MKVHSPHVNTNRWLRLEAKALNSAATGLKDFCSEIRVPAPLRSLVLSQNHMAEDIPLT